MAFRQPTYHAPQRLYTSPEETHHQPSPQSQPLEESQEWILFSPLAPSVTDRTYTTSTDRTRTRTAGHSRISDFGSLDTAARYSSYEEASAHTEAAAEEEEEDGELDSLDSHLHEFGAEPSVYRGERQGESSGTVLPTHDGLGSFRVDQTAMGEEVQKHLYAFERFNPRRVKRRRESADPVLFEVEADRAAEAERTRRIEAWRVEQSRLLVDEIQRETRRRKQSMSSERRTSVLEREQEDVATLSNVDMSVDDEDDPQENESFWNRITKRVIRDLMGIDDDLLSILFGEALPEDTTLSSTPRANSPLTTITPTQPDESSWEYRLLDRIARELGILVNQISDHPGAFSTYLATQQTPLPYAGLPAIPESSRTTQRQPQPTAISPTTSTNTAPINFHPTLQTHPTPPLAIPRSTISLASPSHSPTTDPLTPRPLSREDWERDLDIRLVFRYLRTRFSRSPPAFPLSSTHAHASLATASTADTAARAARVRQHHPLVTTTTTPSQRVSPLRTFRVSVPGKDGMGMGRRGSSSCASALGAGVGKRSGSSRHYWDFGHGHGSASVGSGSMIASTGGMGSWGEV